MIGKQKYVLLIFFIKHCKIAIFGFKQSHTATILKADK